MIKELKFFFYITIIFLFIFLIFKYYFSDVNKKQSYRAYNSINKKISNEIENLPNLENDTGNFLISVENDIKKKRNIYEFWNLLNANKE